MDKYIWNEIEYPLNDSGMSNTIYDLVEQVKNQKQMSSKFNPFKVADSIYFNGLNPTNTLGCGSWGHNSISENLNYTHLMNVSRVARFMPNNYVPTEEELWG